MVQKDNQGQSGAPTIRLGLTSTEWRELQVYVNRHYADISDFFTRKALELIANSRVESGRPPN